MTDVGRIEIGPVTRALNAEQESTCLARQLLNSEILIHRLIEERDAGLERCAEVEADAPSARVLAKYEAAWESIRQPSPDKAYGGSE